MKLITTKVEFMTGAGVTKLVIPIPVQEAENVCKLRKTLDKGKSLEVEIKPYSKHRTLSANAFCWKLCSEIAAALSTVKITKEDIYRRVIRDCGVGQSFGFESKIAAEQFSKRWNQNGIGWITEDIGNNELIAYFGSSTYNSLEMWRLLMSLVEEAEGLGIPLPARKDIDEMIEKCGNKDAY